MKSAVEKLGPTRVKLTVEVPAEELKPSLDAAFTKIASQIQVPGFRKGKVPARLVEQRVGRGPVVEEAVNSMLPSLYEQAMTEHNVSPLGQPELTLDELPLGEGDALNCSFEVDCRPEISIPDLEGLEVTVDKQEIDEAKVDEALTTLRQRFGSLKPVERAAQDGDFVTIDLSATVDGEQIDAVTGVSYEIGSGNMLEGLDDALIGMTAGETKTFTAPLAGGEHQGTESEVTVTATEIKERELPELDDDFAQLASEFDTVEELRTSTRAQVEREALYGQGMQARDKALDAMLDMIDIPVPDSIVEAEVHSHLEGEGRLEDDEHRAEVTESTTRGLRAQLLLDKLVEEREIQVEQGDVIEYLVITAQRYGMQPQQFMQMLEQQGEVPAMVGEVARRKALASVLEGLKIVDTEGNPVHLDALDEKDADDDSDATVAGDTDGASVEDVEAPAEETEPKKKSTKKKAAPEERVADEAATDEGVSVEDVEAPAEETKPKKKSTKKKADDSEA